MIVFLTYNVVFCAVIKDFICSAMFFFTLTPFFQRLVSSKFLLLPFLLCLIDILIILSWNAGCQCYLQ